MTDARHAEELATSGRPTIVRYQVLAWLTAAAALSYLSRNAVGVAESTIREDLQLTLTQSGWFMGAFFWTYALFQVPSGSVAHHVGTRLALTCFALMWSLATLVIGLAPGLALLMIAQLSMGIAQAGIFPASCLSIFHWIPVARRSLGCGVMVTGMQVGAIVASTLTGSLLEWTGWRLVFLLYSAPGIVWAGWFFACFRNDPAEVAHVNDGELKLIRQGRPPEMRTQLRASTPWLAIATNLTVWLLCGQQICRAAGYMFFASWFPTFLQKTRGVSVADSGYLQALVFTGTLLGGLLGGVLTDWIWQRTNNLRVSRSGVGASFLLGCAVLILTAWFVKDISFAIALLTVGSLFAALAGPCAFSATIDVGGSHTPQVFGIMNMMGNFAAAACPVLVGQLFAWTADWNLVLLLFAGVYFIGAVCWVFVNPARQIAT